MNYKLYQVKNGVKYRDYRFTNLSLMKELNLEISLNNYDLVYCGEMNGDVYGEVLEKLFELFNVDHPEDFQGRSMSVGDIVEISGNFYYCDSVGFEKLNTGGLYE